MSNKFWTNKTLFRRQISLSNRVLLVLEDLVKKENISYHEAFEKFISTSPIFKESIKELRKEYKDLE